MYPSDRFPGSSVVVSGVELISADRRPDSESDVGVAASGLF